jgi:hypothetical protein
MFSHQRHTGRRVMVLACFGPYAETEYMAEGRNCTCERYFKLPYLFFPKLYRSKNREPDIPGSYFFICEDKKSGFRRFFQCL